MENFKIRKLLKQKSLSGAELNSVWPFVSGCWTVGDAVGCVCICWSSFGLRGGRHDFLAFDKLCDVRQISFHTRALHGRPFHMHRRTIVSGAHQIDGFLFGRQRSPCPQYLLTSIRPVRVFRSELRMIDVRIQNTWYASHFFQLFVALQALRNGLVVDVRFMRVCGSTNRWRPMWFSIWLVCCLLLLLVDCRMLHVGVCRCVFVRINYCW